MELFHLGDFITRRKEVQEVSHQHFVLLIFPPLCMFSVQFLLLFSFFSSFSYFFFVFCELLVDVSQPQRRQLRLRMWVKG